MQNYGGGDEETITAVENEEEWRLLLETAGDRLVVVDFFAVWCGPCRVISPVFERLSREYGSSAVFLKVDVDRNPGVSAACGVSAMPTFQFYKQGRLLQEMRGANASELERLVALHAGALQPTPAPGSFKKTYQSFPPDTYGCFEGEANLDQVWNKIVQLNDQLKGQDGHMNHETAGKVKALFTLTQDARFRHAATVPHADLALLDRTVASWPQSSVFPLLDIVRRLILVPSAAEYYARAHVPEGNDAISMGMKLVSSDSVGNVLMSVRLLANCFSNLSTRKIVSTSSQALRLVKNHCSHPNKQVRMAVATFLLNYVKASACDKHGAAEDSEQTLNTLLSCMSLEQDDEVKLRIVLALGSLICAHPQLKPAAISHIPRSSLSSSTPSLYLPLQELSQLLSLHPS